MHQVSPPSSAPDPILDITNLAVEIATERGVIRPVDGVGFRLFPGKTLALVGESGCGKSLTALAIMDLLQPGAARIPSGEIRFAGTDLRRLTARQRADLRGDRLAMIFQEPMSALNPAMRIGDQIAEVLVRHRGAGQRAALSEAVGLLRQVGIPAAERRLRDFPHHLSGGMRQRTMIAMALACRPQLLIADEPTTALDVTVQAQILDLLRAARDETGMALILITHDLGVVAELADEVAVMYAGRIVERAPVARLFAEPQHPYTIGLLGAVPRLDAPADTLAVIEGTVPNPLTPPGGCRFHPRCPFAVPACREEAPVLRSLAPHHEAACWQAPLEAAA
jgi:oligopeptide/dipeptide ABC transporter ATP-binding protein